MPDLFSPLRVGPYSLPNRIVMAPMTRNRAGPGETPTTLMATYYAQRASAGLIVTEGTQITPQGQGYPGTPGIHSPAQVEGWRRVVDAVHARGGRIFCQLWHVGRVSHPLLQPDGGLPVAPSALAPAGQLWTLQGMRSFVTPRALEIDEIPGLTEDYRRAAVNASAAGFDGVELHAANGYLLNQFLASNTNLRTDGYGGDVKGRIRFVVEATKAVADTIGADRTAIRISPGHMFNDLVDENPLETHLALLDALDTASLAYVHLMLPDAFDPGLNNAGDPKVLLKAIRARVKGNLIAAGGYTRETAQAALDDGSVQMVAFGRPFIGNPDFVHRIRAGIPLAEANPDLFYTPGPEGYSDYPAAA